MTGPGRREHLFGRTTIADGRRRIVTWGGGIFAPAVTVWFRQLEKLPIRSKWPAAIARTALDQFAFAPIVVSGELV